MDTLSVEQRVKIVQAYYENGRSKKNAFRKLRDFFGRHDRPTERTILNVVHKFEQTGSVQDVKPPTRLRTGRSAENIAAVRENVLAVPETSIRHRSQELDLSYSTTQRILTKDLHLHAYKIQITQELKPADHLKRRVFANWMREKDADFSKKIVFSDEAHFHLSGYVNKQNCRIWGSENPRVTTEHQMHPQKVTVWCGLWSQGVIGPYFFEDDDGAAVTVNGNRYRNMLEQLFRTDFAAMDLRDIWFQQDGATPHTATATIDLLHTQFPGRVISKNGDCNWPPRSCDLTPLDFFLWGYLKGKVYANAPATIQELKNSIIHEIEAIEPQLCDDVIENYNKRITSCHLSRGGHLNDIVFHT